MAILAAAIVLAIGLGTAAYGAVFSWAYWPLLGGCGAIGLLGLARRRDGGTIERGLLWALAAILAVVLLQVLPLPRAVLAAVSPSTDAFLQDYDLQYSRALLSSSPVFHPLSIDPGATWRAAAFVLGIGVLFIGLVRGLTRRDTEQVVVGIVVLGVAFALHGIVQKAVSPGLIYGFRAAGSEFGPFANRNHFAGWMLMALPLAIGYVFSRASRLASRNRSWRTTLLALSSSASSGVVLTAVSVLIMGVALVLTLSRSAVSAFVLALALAAWFFTREQRGTRRAATAGGLVLLGLLSVGWVGVDRIVQRFAAIDERIEGGGRLTIWRDTLGIVRTFPFAGTGMNTYDTAMLAYESIEPHAFAEEAHNDYLQLAAEGGILMTGAAAWLAVMLAREIRRRFREDAGDWPSRHIRAGAVTGLVAIGLQELVDFSLQLPANAALFAVLCAIAVRPEEPQPVPVREASGASRTRAWTPAVYSGGAAARQAPASAGGRSRTMRSLPLVVLALCLAAVPSAAQTGSDPAGSARLRLGPFGVTPTISLRDVGIDTNVFNESVDPKQDFTATLQTALDAWLRLGRARLHMDGTLEGVYFKRYSSQRSVGGGGSATLEYDGNRIGAFAGGGLRSTRQRTNFEIDERARQVHRSVTAGGSLRVSGKTSFGATVDRSTVDFENDAESGGQVLGQALNRRETTVGAFVDYEITPLTTILVRADFQRDDFDHNPLRNARRLRITPGVEFKPFALMAGSAVFGYQKFEPLGTTDESFNSTFASIDLSYTFRGRTRLAVQGNRDVEYSFQPLQPFYVVTGVSGSIYQAISTSWGLTARAGRQRLDYGEILPLSMEGPPALNIVSVNGYGAGVVWRLSPDLQVGINADFQRRQGGGLFHQNYEGLKVGSFVTYGGGGR